MMKKTIALTLALILTLTLVACGNADKNADITPSAITEPTQTLDQTTKQETPAVDTEDITTDTEDIAAESDEITADSTEKTEEETPEDADNAPVGGNTAGSEEKEQTNATSQNKQEQHKHSYTPDVKGPATCGSDGVKVFTCACGDTYTEKIPATGNHNYVPKVTTAATCNTAGIKTYTCNCGSSYTEAIVATGHSWGSWTTVKASTAVEPGISQHKCSKCSAVESKELEMLPNYYKNAEFESRMEENKINVLPYEAYFENGAFVVKVFLINNTNKAVTGLSVNKMAVYDKHDNKIAEGTFQAQSYTLQAYTYEIFTYRFVSADVVSYAVDLSHIYTHSTINK